MEGLDSQVAALYGGGMRTRKTIPSSSLYWHVSTNGMQLYGSSL